MDTSSTTSGTALDRSQPPDLSDKDLRSVERIAAEHQARGLLNLIALVTWCLDSGGLAERQAQQFGQARAEAAEGLDRLYGAGLPREFHLTSRA